MFPPTGFTDHLHSPTSACFSVRLMPSTSISASLSHQAPILSGRNGFCNRCCASLIIRPVLYRQIRLMTQRRYPPIRSRIITPMTENYASKRERWQKQLDALPESLRGHISLRNVESVSALPAEAQQTLAQAIQAGLNRILCIRRSNPPRQPNLECRL